MLGSEWEGGLGIVRALFRKTETDAPGGQSNFRASEA